MAAIFHLKREDTSLLIVDIQERLAPSMHDYERFVANCVLLARAARQLELPIVVTEQYPEKLGPTLPVIVEAAGSVAPISKLLFSACTEATLDRLRAAGRSTILLCGNEAHVCVLQTALDLLEEGYTVFVAQDAISSRRESNKQVGWERMRHAGALPTSAESAVFELLREAGTPDFKALLPFIK